MGEKEFWIGHHGKQETSHQSSWPLTTLFRRIASFSHSTFTNSQVLLKSQILTALKIAFLYAPAKGLQKCHAVWIRSQKSPPAIKKIRIYISSLNDFSDLYYRDWELDSARQAGPLHLSTTHREQSGHIPHGSQRLNPAPDHLHNKCQFRSRVCWDRGRVVTPTPLHTQPHHARV